jgi:hypothetical protein
MSVSIAELTGQAISQTIFGSLKLRSTLTSSTHPAQPAMDLETLSMSSTRCPHSVERLIVQIPRALTLWGAKEWMSRENTCALGHEWDTDLPLFQLA